MTGLLGLFSHLQLITNLSRFFSSSALPMPFTSSNSSTAVNGPLLSRYATIAFALEAPIPNRSRRRVSASAALRLTLVDCSILVIWVKIGVGASGLMEGAAVVATEREVRKAKTRDEM